MNEWQLIERPQLDGNSAAPHERVALRILLEAYDCARALKRDVWQFAVEIQEFLKSGVRSCELRKLVVLGLAMHAQEVAGSQSGSRKFRKNSTLAFTGSSCFVLTEQGESHARTSPLSPRVIQMGSEDNTHNDNDRHASNGKSGPRWDSHLRVLFMDDLIVKQFKRPAPHQELVIASFQELHWNRRIDDPIPPDRGMNSKERLHDTIKKLNQRQLNSLIRFYGDGTGRGICWEPRTRTSTYNGHANGSRTGRPVLTRRRINGIRARERSR